MRKVFGLLVISIVAALLVNSLVLLAGDVVEFSNAICPITGEKIKAGEEVKYEHNGVNYNLCCKMCIKDFGKDPEHYIKKMEVEKKLGQRKAIETTVHEHHH